MSHLEKFTEMLDELEAVYTQGYCSDGDATICVILENTDSFQRYKFDVNGNLTMFAGIPVG